MARITIRSIALELEAARLRIAELEGTITALRNVAVSPKNTSAQRWVYRPATPSAESLAFRAKCLAAREAAISTEKSVAV